MQLSPAIFFCFNSLVINAFRLLSELYNTFIIPYFFVWELRGSIQNVAWTKCRTKYVKPLVHR